MEQLIIELVELIDGDLLMAEHLDDLLAVHHLLNVAIDLAQLLLLLDEKLAGVASQVFGGQQHHADHRQRQQRQRDTEVNHRCQHADQRDDRVDQLGQALADHLAQGVGIVGVNRHNIAVGVGIEILDGQRLHVGEHLITQILQRTLCDAGHQTVLHKDSSNTDTVERSHTQDGGGQTAEIRAARTQQRQNVAVNQRLGEHDALQLGENRQQNTAEHNNDLRLVQIHHIGKDTLEHLAGVFDLGAGAVAAPAGANFDNLRLLCHYTSPPFSSKSPEPLVWLL